MQIVTDKTIIHNRPKIVLLNKQRKFAYIVDVAVPVNDNIGKTYVEKQNIKTLLMKWARKHIYLLENINIIPLVIKFQHMAWSKNDWSPG